MAEIFLLEDAPEPLTLQWDRAPLDRPGSWRAIRRPDGFPESREERVRQCVAQAPAFPVAFRSSACRAAQSTPHA